MSLHWEWWPTSEGQSVASWLLRKGSGHGDPTWVREDHRVDESSRGLTRLKSDYGQWVDFAFRFRVSSGPGVEDAMMQIYKNGELIQEKDNFVAYPAHEDDYHLAGFDRGYLLGYHNAAYAEDTIYYIADFKIGTSGGSVGMAPEQR